MVLQTAATSHDWQYRSPDMWQSSSFPGRRRHTGWTDWTLHSIILAYYTGSQLSKQTDYCDCDWNFCVLQTMTNWSVWLFSCVIQTMITVICVITNATALNDDLSLATSRPVCLKCLLQAMSGLQPVSNYTRKAEARSWSSQPWPSNKPLLLNKCFTTTDSPNSHLGKK